MARFSPSVAALALLAVAPLVLTAQRPALSGEKAQVAEAVRQDLNRLSRLQKTHHDRTKMYAADPRDVGFNASSGAEINIAFASMNAWAANATHAVLSPVKCFVIVSAADAADAPTAQPFCTDAEPGTAAGRVASSTAPTTPTAPAKSSPPPAAQTATKQAPPPSRPAPSRPAPARQQAAAPARQAPTTTTTTPNRPSPAAAASSASAITAGGGPAGQVPGAARLSTREVIAGASVADRGESVSAQQFAGVLSDFAASALAVLNAPRPEVVRDPYESTAEFEQRRATAAAEYARREADFFRANTRTYSVQMTVRNVKYDADREVVEFAVDPVRLPVMGGGAGSQLSLTCYTRPVFWCSPDSGMIYDAGDLWRVPRATARQHDVLRTPMTLTARYTVGRLEGERALAVSLVDMELQARGQLVQRWPATAR